MWSLYKIKEGESRGIPDNSREKLYPLKFSNGKTQEDVVREVLDAIKNGNKVIFIKGVCGSGKSAVALNLAKHFNKTSIIVPIKSLQGQYETDYTKKKFILKDDGSKLKISVIKGRNNFRCPFSGERADDSLLPCTIEIRDKNTERLLKYIESNPLIDKTDFSSASDIRRMNIAPACPYWSPILPADLNPKGLRDVNKKKFMAICEKEHALFQRKKGCGYYDQYASYTDSDVLIFNSQKYLIETMIGRKPKTDIEIIDECDEFLDNFANEKTINLNRLHSSLVNLMPTDPDKKTKIKELIFEINSLIFNPPKIEVEKLKSSVIQKLIGEIIENPSLAEDEELSYFNNAVENARIFENILDETYVSVETIKKESGKKGLFEKNSDNDNVVVTLVSINLAEKFKELADRNNVLIMMSGTLHSEQVLMDIFGLENFKIIEAETKSPGKINKIRTGFEMNCSFSNFTNGTITRKRYLKILDLIMANAKPPVLVHVSAFKDLPSEEENSQFKFDNLITQERINELQSKDNSAVEDFANGETDVLFTTKCSRGIDFPGEKCNSIVITRFPYPNIQGLFWKILKKEQPEKFMKFYMDKARRELIQKVARGVRFKGDYVNLLSPDVRVLNENIG
ncbi:MAG: helicase C-terminal domain-containing protein [Nanoarchaeota archaeon]|nr:helicase C-terminal domain-containing protein [Nanoarchaeota archaeon]